jgi:hypothetical protein
MLGAKILSIGRPELTLGLVTVDTDAPYRESKVAMVGYVKYS